MSAVTFVTASMWRLLVCVLFCLFPVSFCFASFAAARTDLLGCCCVLALLLRVCIAGGLISATFGFMIFIDVGARNSLAVLSCIFPAIFNLCVGGLVSACCLCMMTSFRSNSSSSPSSN